MTEERATADNISSRCTTPQKSKYSEIIDLNSGNVLETHREGLQRKSFFVALDKGGDKKD